MRPQSSISMLGAQDPFCVENSIGKIQTKTRRIFARLQKNFEVSNETEMIGIFSRKNMTSFWDDFLQHDLSPGSAHDVQLS